MYKFKLNRYFSNCFENLLMLAAISVSALRTGSAAARLLGLRAGIPLGAWMSVSYECCVLSARGLCDGPIHRPK